MTSHCICNSTVFQQICQISQYNKSSHLGLSAKSSDTPQFFYLFFLNRNNFKFLIKCNNFYFCLFLLQKWCFAVWVWRDKGDSSTSHLSPVMSIWGCSSKLQGAGNAWPVLGTTGPSWTSFQCLVALHFLTITAKLHGFFSSLPNVHYLQILPYILKQESLPISSSV